MLKNYFMRGMLSAAGAVALVAALSVSAQTAPSYGQAGSTASQAQTGSATGQTGGSTSQGGSAAGGQTGQTGQPEQVGTGAAAGMGTASGAMNASDQKMLKTMAVNNLAEIEAARMAQGKTQNERVRTFAQRMIDDHTKALDDVRQLAQAKGVALPTEVDSASKRKMARLAAMSGDAFDRAYMAQAGVADHKKNHALLQQAQTRARDADLKALAARTLPVVDQHLNAAQELHKNTAQGSSRTEGSTGSSDKRE